MRIVIDMQGAQSFGSRNRGIGRYTLSIVKALLRNADTHEIILALNGLFFESIAHLKSELDGLLPQTNIRVWTSPGPIAHSVPNTTQLRHAAELTYEAFLLEQKPDFIYVTSLFEGLSDDAATSIHQLGRHIPVAVTLYDLIPLVNPTLYLADPLTKAWYAEKVDHLRRADIWLTISEASRQEAVTHLGLPENHCINISTDADQHFQPLEISPDREQALRKRYGLHQPFVMYTGGIDHRKNIEGLMRAYACLPNAIRQTHQLAIVCSISDQNRQTLLRLASELGLEHQEVVLTGFVHDNELLALYNICRLFVFPSWHEGFGLPALEAMRCGAPVIAANTSSLPEVIGMAEALFDPRNEESIKQLMLRALTEETFRATLVQHGISQAKKFSWDRTAQRALRAMEKLKLTHAASEAMFHKKNAVRRKLAYFSPLPPTHSGIADYSAELLPVLSNYYDIEVIAASGTPISDKWILDHLPLRTTQWFIEHAAKYERIIYQFGNSAVHQHMFNLIEQFPGVVVLHDFYLSGAQAYREAHGWAPNAWTNALYSSHGYHALHARNSETDPAEVIWKYPANLEVLQRALGVVVHGKSSISLAKKWYGENAGNNWAVIPLLRKPATKTDRTASKRALGFTEDDLLICTFGMLGKTKLNHRLLAAWLNSQLATDRKVHLVFVGENDAGDYGKQLLKDIRAKDKCERVKITGWTDTATFHQYLAAADIGVQLRTLSRGETSAAVLDCMNYGLATIVNAHGSMADLDTDGVWMLPDNFTEQELISALTELAYNVEKRQLLGSRAKEIVSVRHAPEKCGALYAEAIEAGYSNTQQILPRLYQEISKLNLPQSELTNLATALAENFPATPRQKQLLVDISGLDSLPQSSKYGATIKATLKKWLLNPPNGLRVEPISISRKGEGYKYAKTFTSSLLMLPAKWPDEVAAEAWPGDAVIVLSRTNELSDEQQAHLRDWQARGVQASFINDALATPSASGLSEKMLRALQDVVST